MAHRDRRWSERCDEMAAHVASGQSLTEVARRMGVYPSQVRSACVVRGVETPRAASVRRAAAMAARVAAGLSLSAVAREFGVSATAVLYACRRSKTHNR